MSGGKRSDAWSKRRFSHLALGRRCWLFWIWSRYGDVDSDDDFYNDDDAAEDRANDAVAVAHDNDDEV